MLLLISFFFILLSFQTVSGTYESKIQRLQEYLKINTAYPEPDYESAISWIKTQANEIGLNYNHFNLGSDAEKFKKFTIVLTWNRSEKKILNGNETIGLYSHIDVVGTDGQTWSFDPFGAEIKDDLIYARGSQDMKTIGVQYLEAIRNLKQSGFVPHRSIHLLFLPDEERGGSEGAKLLVETEFFKQLNLGLIIDEGLPNSDEVLQVYNSGRVGMVVNITTTGPNGHGSLLLKNTAGEKLAKVFSELFSLRKHMELQLDFDHSLKLGEVASINLNFIEGGTFWNVIPTRLSAIFDIRYPAAWDLSMLFDFIEKTCRNAGEGVTYKFSDKYGYPKQHNITNVDSETWWWSGFKNALNSMKIKFDVCSFPAGTDGRFFRELGIPVLGMSPIFNTKNTMHSADESISIKNFVQGIEIYEKLIENLTKL